MSAAERELQRYGKTLLQHLPQETTQLMIDLCCGTLHHHHLPQNDTDPDAHSTAAKRSGIHAHQSPENINGSNGSTPELPSPKQFMPHFATQEAEYIYFLQEVLDRRYSHQASSTDPESINQAKSIHNALLELYLSQADRRSSQKSGLHAQALELLQSDLVDLNQALLVCIGARFEAGMVVLYERLGGLEDLFRYRTRSSAPAEALDMLWKYSDAHPQLLVAALRWLTSDASLLSAHSADAERVLGEVQQRGLLKPVETVRILARNPHASVGLTKPYLKACFEGDADEIESNRGLVDSYQQEISRKGRDFDALMDGKQPQVLQTSRCSACGGALDNPSVQ